MVTRRGFLAGALVSAATPGLAAAPGVSLRPFPRPSALALRTVPSAADLIDAASIGGRVGFAVADAATGQMLETLHPLFPLPPASVTKAITCAYGLDRLGPGFRFRTQVLADGPVLDGRLDGDLWLVGAGDPLFDTDALAGLAQGVRDIGLREVTGRLMVADGALPHFFEIDPSQPDHVGYNPAISGLNLNFNRVHFEWTRQADDYAVTMDARSETRRPPVRMAQMQIAERAVPVYTYDQVDGRDQWTVARGALGNGGARWLPVRRPEAYLAEVFQNLSRSFGLRLDSVEFAERAPDGAVLLAEHVSEPLDDILRGMMRWSTNLTAEVVGLHATQAGGVRPVTLAASADEMSAWMADRLGARQADFVDHSGLSDQSRIRPQDMTYALVTAGPNGQLRDLMKLIPVTDAEGATIPGHPVEIRAKTGTLNFVSTLAGYIRTAGGRDLAFSVFCADVPRRAALTEAERERPPGGRAYARAARRLHQQLAQRWATLYDV